MSEDQEYLYEQARKKVKKKKEFYTHLGVFLASGLFFFLLNFFTSGLKDLWFIFPLIPWSLGLSVHYITTFGLPFRGLGSEEWEDKEIAQEMARLNKKYRSEPLDDFRATDSLELKELQKRKNYGEEDFV